MTADAKIILGGAMIALGIMLLLIVLRLRRGKPGPSPLAKIAEARRLERAAREAEAAKSVAQIRVRNRIWLHPVGFVARLIVYAALFGFLYLYAPNDISKIPLARLTLNDIFGAALFVGAVIVLIRALFNPSELEEVKDVWGWMGVAIILIVSCGIITFALFRGS